jgi:hypothetical protein
VIDITLGYLGLLESITSWEVSLEPSFLDHRHLLFTLRGSVLVHLIRIPTGTNWVSFQEDLRDGLGRGLEMNMGDEVGLGLTIHWVQQALITAYEDKCPLRPVKTGSCSLKWTAQLESLRRGVRRLFNTFTAKIDHSRFNNSCLRFPASTLVNLIFQSRSFSLGGKIVQQLQYI